MAFTSGFVSIIGRPNTGKSTLLNALLGEKISIVSKRAQTTRNVIKGVKNITEGQIVFLDTPGIHKGRGALSSFMLREAMNSIKDVDALVLLVEAVPPARGDISIIKALKSTRAPVILCPNKVDTIRRDDILPVIEGYKSLYPFHEILPISALKGQGLEMLLSLLKAVLPEGPPFFPADMVTDQPERFVVSEMVREKVFRLTRQEIPYSTAVMVEEFKEGRKVISIRAVINVERDSQKGIIIGKQGAMLKKIGTQARGEIERFLGAKVYLELFVRVKKDWTGNERSLREFGY
ncbi:MAG: GTPase Era [Thermodesulfobacteriota bacterium]